MSDLLILLPDKDILSLLEGLLSRTGFIRPVLYEAIPHEDRDHGCRKKYEHYVRGRNTDYQKLLVIFDRHGCGDDRDRETIEQEMETRIKGLGWPAEHICVLCIEPEIEQWLWVHPAHIQEALNQKQIDVHQFLEGKELKATNQIKPPDPKKAWQTLTKACGKKPSPTHFKQIGTYGSIGECTDPAFLKLKACLTSWFG